MSYWLRAGATTFGSSNATEEGDHIVGHHLVAIVELHATAELERPSLDVFG